MYLSAIATFLGFGLYARSLAVLAFAGAWFLMIHFFVVFIEEPGLRRRFGGTYDAYRSPRASMDAGRGGREVIGRDQEGAGNASRFLDLEVVQNRHGPAEAGRHERFCQRFLPVWTTG